MQVVEQKEFGEVLGAVSVQTCALFVQSRCSFAPCAVVRRGRVMLRNNSDLTGLLFGKLHVERLVPGVVNLKGILWRCRCTCRKYGKRVDVWSYDLLSGRVIDCGCTKKARKRKRKQRNRERTRERRKLRLIAKIVCVTFLLFMANSS